MISDSALHSTAHWYSWELRGRGWGIWERPVELEAPFFAYYPYRATVTPSRSRENSGRQPTVLSLISEGIGSLFAKKQQQEEPPFPEIARFAGSPVDMLAFSILPPKDKGPIPQVVFSWLASIARSQYPISFEILGDSGHIGIKVLASVYDYPSIISQARAFFPSLIVEDGADPAYIFDLDLPCDIIDLGLSDEWTRPLSVYLKPEPDSLTAIFAVLEGLKGVERGLVQILFQGAVDSWGEEALKSLVNAEGKPFFTDAPDMLPLAKQKAEHPLFSVILRVMGQGADEEHSHDIAGRLAHAVIAATASMGNSLIPLDTFNILDEADRVGALLERQSYRTGMLLNAAELAQLVHVPTVRTSKFTKGHKKSVAPPEALQGKEVEVGENHFAGHATRISVSIEDRLRHTHVIGATGTGKSTSIINLARQDMESGRGLVVFDPHGDLIESIIAQVPESRIEDVVLVDPADIQHPIGLNILEAHTEQEKIVLSSDMVGIFKRIATSWGDQMSWILANAVDAFLHHPKGGSLLDLRNFLVDATFRNKVLQEVTDPYIVSSWKEHFPMLKRHVVAPLLTRLDTFLRPRIIRAMMQQRSGLDLNTMIEDKKIILFKLSQGLIGEENAYLLGSLLVAKLHQAALARQALSKEERHPFFVYMDEFQHFLTPSMSSLLSGTRKYGLGLVLAHQEMQQLIQTDRGISSAVISNAHIRLMFRVGNEDAKRLEKESRHFDAEDLMELGIGEAIIKVGSSDNSCDIKTPLPPEVTPEEYEKKRERIVAGTQANYGGVEIVEASPQREATEMPSEDAEIIEEAEAKEEIPKPESEVTEDVSSERDLEKEAAEFIKAEGKRDAEREHTKIVTAIRREAQARGFKATVEEATPDGGRVDLGLNRSDIRIACEVSVTNTPDYEAKNIRKCVNARYDVILMISNKEQHLVKIKEALGDYFQEHILFTHLDGVPGILDHFHYDEPEENIKGYRVKINYSPTDARSHELRQKRIIRTIIEMSRKKK